MSITDIPYQSRFMQQRQLIGPGPPHTTDLGVRLVVYTLAMRLSVLKYPSGQGHVR